MKSKTREESKLERDVIKAFRDAGWYARHVDPSPGEAGFPDVLAICGNKYALVELKTKTTLRPSQKVWAKKHGGKIWNRFLIEEGTDFIYKITAYPIGSVVYNFACLTDCIKTISITCEELNEH